MKKIFCILILALSATAADAQRYLFFLHNMFLELEGINGVHPEYGRCEYNEILDSFRKKGFIVISEVRPKNTDGTAYAHKVAGQVDSLREKGVKASQITIIGTSKGGYIAQLVSGLLKKNHLNFVFIGSCDEYPDEKSTIQWYGNVLSIYEQTDKWLSCERMKNRPGNKLTHYKEIQLNTGMKHGFLYKALPEWIEPAAKWAKQQYE